MEWGENNETVSGAGALAMRGTMGHVVMTRVIAITSGKGGVGKTHTTINLGLTLSKLGKRVLLLDADLGLANINVMLGFEPRATVEEVLRGKASLNDIVVSHPSGIDIIPASSGIQELSHLSEGERLALIEGVETLGKRYDYLLIDTGAGVGSNVMFFNAAAHDVLVVIDQEPTSLTDAYALIKIMSSRHGVNNFLVLVNRTPSNIDGKTVFSQLMTVTGKFLNVRLQYLGSIADDESVTQAIVSRKPFVEIYPSSRTSTDISQIARKLVATPAARNCGGGIQFFFQELLRGSAT